LKGHQDDTSKLECLAKFIVFGKRHMDYLISEVASYYNTKRSHMERDHLPPIRAGEPEETVTLTMEQIEVKQFVGGLVNLLRERRRSKEYLVLNECNCH
jgi:putative transposase